MKKVPVSLIPALNAGAEKQVVPYENTMDYFKSNLNGLMLRTMPDEYKDFISALEGATVGELFDLAAMLNKLICFSEEKRSELPDNFIEILWRLVKIKHNFYRTPTWCVYDPFLICTDGCKCCDSFNEEDPWDDTSWTFEDLDWLIQDEEMLPAWD